MTKFLTRQERDRYWIGRCLFLRRKILGLCEQDGNICKKSVVRIIDQCLPESIVKAEKKKPTRRKK